MHFRVDSCSDLAVKPNNLDIRNAVEILYRRRSDINQLRRAERGFGIIADSGIKIGDDPGISLCYGYNGTEVRHDVILLPLHTVVVGFKLIGVAVPYIVLCFCSMQRDLFALVNGTSVLRRNKCHS